MSGGYGEKEYWDKRYSVQDQHYDWYLQFDQFKERLLPKMVFPADRKGEAKVLVVGCGNSDLSEDLLNEGFTDISSIDYSEVVIKRMVDDVTSRRPELKFTVMDARELKYAKDTFDVIIDKGTLDAILCGNESAKRAADMLSEAHRVLKPGGNLFVITYGNPASRLTYLEKSRYKWTTTHELLGETRYMYSIIKRGALDVPPPREDTSKTS